MTNLLRKSTVVTEAVGDGLAVFDPQQQQSYLLNATSALVFQHCDGQTTPAQMTTLLRQKFNLPQAQAEQLTWLSLTELEQAHLLQNKVPTTQAPRPVLTRRQLLSTMVTVGLSLALLPIVTKVAKAATGSVFPTLQCVLDNGDGTYTAYFGYINTSNDTVPIPYDPSHAKNMFTSEPKYRGQPDMFEPGTHEFVFSVVFDGSKITWMIKEDQAARQQVDATADSGCATPPTTTTTAPPTTTTTTAPPTTTTAPPTTTTTAPPTTTTTAPTTTTTTAPTTTTTTPPPITLP